MSENITLEPALEPCTCAADLPDRKRALQIELELLHNKNQTVPRIRKEFETAHLEPGGFDFTAFLTLHGVPVNFGLDLMVQMALHKRCKIEVMVGILRHHFEDSQLTADMILKCVEIDLVDWIGPLRVLMVKVTVNAELQAELDRYQYPLPMVVAPQPITNNRETGYLMSGGSVILKKNHHEDDVCLDHLNRVNAIRFAINEDVVTFVKHRWKGLDKAKPGETKEEFERRKKAFEKYDLVSREVIAKILSLGNEFYLTHKYDKRGRIYCQGYHVNYQGTPWNKAVIELADKEYID